MTDGDTITIQIPADNWWTSNHRLHRMDEARRTRAVRLTAMFAAKTGLAAVERADVLVTVHTPTRWHFDPPNCYPMAKAAIDGIVDAGVLPGDTSAHIPRTTFQLGPKTGEKGVYRLTIQLIPKD